MARRNRTPAAVPARAASNEPIFENIDANDLTEDQVECIEKVSLRLAFQALVSFAPQARDIFFRSPDLPQDVAEDVTREAASLFRGFPIRERLVGTLDYKEARWLPMPFGLVPQALFIESKAKKLDEQNRVSLQRSQVSLPFYDSRHQEAIEPRLPVSYEFLFDGGTRHAITTVITSHYTYERKPEPQVGYFLKKLVVASVPNGKLNDTYSPSREGTIFLQGQHSHDGTEELRARISYERFRQFKYWRVQEIDFGTDGPNPAYWREASPGNPPTIVNVPVITEPRFSPMIMAQGDIPTP